MYVTINSAATFMDEFNRMGRGDQFSDEAQEALYDFYDELDDYELDVIAICCDWTEYASEEDALEYYGVEDIDAIQDNHFMIKLNNGGLLVQD